MKEPTNLNCPNCDSQLNRETAPQSEGYSASFANWKGVVCPCCDFFVQNSSKPCAIWAELEAVAIGLGANLAGKGGDRDGNP
jgi:hypothetical protein